VQSLANEKLTSNGHHKPPAKNTNHSTGKHQTELFNNTDNKGNYAKNATWPTSPVISLSVIGGKRERLVILHINTSQYSKIFLLNELKKLY
jgi:hypothetical protein